MQILTNLASVTRKLVNSQNFRHPKICYNWVKKLKCFTTNLKLTAYENSNSSSTKSGILFSGAQIFHEFFVKDRYLDLLLQYKGF